jgi:hypothetical protein
MSCGRDCQKANTGIALTIAIAAVRAGRIAPDCIRECSTRKVCSGEINTRQIRPRQRGTG